MEVSALRYSGGIGLHGRSPLLRLQSDERLVTFTRRGNSAAFEVLVSRYQTRLLSFCRHLLGSREDAEDVLQEVLSAAFNAILADDRPINVRPWLYRIARNRSLNHLRRVQAVGVDSMDIHLFDHGASTADRVHERDEFRTLVADIHGLPETQRTALVLREMDALSYEQIAEAMGTTVPSVKSLLVRARVSLAEAAEARLLSCDEVRIELGEVAEGLLRKPGPLVRRHLRSCERCSRFRGQLKETNKALTALLPLGPMVVLKKLALTHLGHSAGAGSSASGASTAGQAAAVGSTAAGATAAVGSGAGGIISAGIGTIATKAAAGLAAAALLTAGAVEVTTGGRHHLKAYLGSSIAAIQANTPTISAQAYDASARRGSHKRHSKRALAPALSAVKTPSLAASSTQKTAVKPKLAQKPVPKRVVAVKTTRPKPPPGPTQTQTDPTVLPPQPISAKSESTTTTGPDSTTTRTVTSPPPKKTKKTPEPTSSIGPGGP